MGSECGANIVRPWGCCGNISTVTVTMSSHKLPNTQICCESLNDDPMIGIWLAISSAFICIHLHSYVIFICYIMKFDIFFLNLMISLFLFESAHVFHFFRSAGGLTAGSRGYGETSQFICAVAQWDQWSTAEKSPHKDHKAGSAMSWLVSPVWLKTSFKEFAAFPMTLAPATSVAWLKTESEDGDWMRLACFLCFCNFCL